MSMKFKANIRDHNLLKTKSTQSSQKAGKGRPESLNTLIISKKNLAGVHRERKRKPCLPVTRMLTYFTASRQELKKENVLEELRCGASCLVTTFTSSAKRLASTS